MTLILEAEQSLEILKVVAAKNTRIKQLEEEFNTCEKLLDETRSDLYKEQAENQRLTEALQEILILNNRDWANCESAKYVQSSLFIKAINIAQKALEGK